MKIRKFTLAAIMLLCCVSAVMGDSYYKIAPQFHEWPNEGASSNTIGRFGPVGIGLNLIQPAFTMQVKNVEPGSPADGKLKKGQIIESINGQVLKDMDPRIILGNMITDAESKDGTLKMMVKDNKDAPAKEVVIKIPALGAYSPTWPVDCKKSDKIVRDFAEFLAKVDKPSYGSVLFLLSTGQQKDLDVVRRWFANGADAPAYPWDIGYNGPAVCEYYLRTGDKKVLPAIQKMADNLKKTVYNGGWAGRGAAPFEYMAGGHMNAAGVHCVTFLMLAKECGVDVDEHTLQSSLKQFYRYSGHGNVPYGDGVPEGGFVDNGKSCGLAFTMAAAASLTPEGENSVYAKARDINATKGFYSTSWLFHGHTGGGIGELWRGPTMGLLKDKRPQQYRTFMDGRRWMYELARTHDGAFGWSESWNVNYTNTGHAGGRAWGNYIPMIYTVPRKTLRMTGAPKTKYSKSYQLPKRPWGTAADDIFFSLQPGEYKPGKRQDLSAERLITDASMPIINRLSDSKVSDDTLLMYAHHIEQGLRAAAARSINNHSRYHLVIPLLKSKDPRGRQAGLTCITGMFKGRGMPTDKITDEMFNLVAAMINDPQESWWVVDTAMNALGRARPELIAPHVDRLSYWLKHDDWWLRKAAMTALTPVAADKRYYKTILPIIGRMIANNTCAVALSPLSGIVRELQRASPSIQSFAVATLGKAYCDFPKQLTVPGGQDMKSAESYLLDIQARNLTHVAGGFDELYRVSRERKPDEVLSHRRLYMDAHDSAFGPEVKEAIKPVVLNYLIPEFMGEANHIASNKDYLLNEASGGKPYKWNGYYREPRMAPLVRLYNRIGIHDYDWHLFGPDLNEITWDYHTFDPAEEKPLQQSTHYRKVTYPKGMENWFTPKFDAKSAGWKSGRAPFGQLDGKLAGAKKGDGSEVIYHGCGVSFCRCNEPMNTFWDKEVLIMRTRLKWLPFKDGHRYRLLVGGMSHADSGEGYQIYINGKLMMERKQGMGRREGGLPQAYYIDKAWWPDFAEEVTIAATGFMPVRGGKKRNHLSIWLEEMKIPPLPEEMFLRGFSMRPMRCTVWQATKNDEDKYGYDDTFVPNKDIVGQWARLGRVEEIESFDPEKELSSGGRPLFNKITFNNDGTTDNKWIIWSDDTLMELKDLQALKMTAKTIGGADYLFIEVGGFSRMYRDKWTPDHPADWRPALYVMKRQ
jgi:hypothetical protein